MDIINDSESVSELLKLRTKLEQNLSDAQEENCKIRQHINVIENEKTLIRKTKARELQKQYLLKIELASAQSEREAHVKILSEARERFRQSNDSIKQAIGLKEFGDEINNLRSTIESAINYYSDDSINLEMVRRGDSIREKRVELTRLTTEYEALKNKIEEEKREMERQRQSEIEKEKQELERRKREEEEQLKAEKARQREEFLKQKYAPREIASSSSRPDTPFRNITSNACSPEPDSKPSFSSGDGLSTISRIEIEEKPIFHGNSSSRQYTALPSLSQFANW